MRFTVVDERVPAVVLQLLREACDARDVEYVAVDAPSFDFDPSRRLGAGDLLFRAATSLAATRVEQFLHAPGVATFYAERQDGVFFIPATQPLHFERAGLPVPETVYCASTDRELLKSWVTRLGGFPILAKMGGQAGIGVVLLESYPALCSFVDYALAQRRNPMLTAYLPGGTLWRAVVVGERVVAAYPCTANEGDFRAVNPGPRESFTTEPEPRIAKLAVDAVRTLRLEFGGVDLLEHDGALYLLECNFPCYFPHAQVIAGIDVAGAMIDHLIDKAGRV